MALPDDVFDNGFSTGSRVWGIAIPGSDWDFVVHPDYKGLDNHLRSPRASYLDADTAEPLILEHGDRTFNFIFPIDITAFHNWGRATATMSRMVSQSPEFRELITDKLIRVAIFRHLRGIR